MPTKPKSRTNSRKSTASSQGKPVVLQSEDEIPSIVVVSRKPSSRKTTPSSPRPEFLEPLSPLPPPPPPTPWQILQMKEEEYEALLTRVRNEFLALRKKESEEASLAEMNTPVYWLRRIEQLEVERELFNKKRGWSAMDQACVEKIDAQIEECEGELDRMYSEEDMMEYLCD